MVSEEAMAPGAAAVAEAKAHARITGDEEEALVGRLTTSAASLCEQFIGQALLARGFVETVPVAAAWTRLARTPVRAVTRVEGIDAKGAAVLLPEGAYAVDIDANGDGWIRVTGGVEAARIRVGYEAGMAAEWDGVPAALRHGIVRLVAHLFAERGGGGGAGPPAAVTALWRPWRRMRLG